MKRDNTAPVTPEKRPVLFTTSDGFEIRLGDSYFYIGGGYKIIKATAKHTVDFITYGKLESAQKYVEEANPTNNEDKEKGFSLIPELHEGLKDVEGETWDYEIVPNEGEIHIFNKKDNTVAIASIYAQPLGHEEYERAKLICAAPAMYRVLKKLLLAGEAASEYLQETGTTGAYLNESIREAKALLNSINKQP